METYEKMPVIPVITSLILGLAQFMYQDIICAAVAGVLLLKECMNLPPTHTVHNVTKSTGECLLAIIFLG